MEASVAWALEQHGGDKAAVLDEWRNMYRPDAFEGEWLQNQIRILDRLDYNKLKPGNLYEVSIDADPEDFLDWDAPLSEQPEGVRRLMQEEYDWRRARGLDADASNSMVGRLDRGELTGRDIAEGWAARLPEAGIPGIRYYDQGSRGAGEGTRNYVLFDDSLATILNKYGLAGLAVGGGMALTPSEEAEIEAYLGGI